MRISKRLAIAVLSLSSFVGIVGDVHAVSPSASARHALNVMTPDLNLTGVTLNDALEFIRDVATTNVHVNWPALEAAGVSKETPVNIRLHRVALRKVLGLLLAESSSGAPLTFYVDDGVVEVTTQELADKQLITRIYPVDDLIMEVPDFIAPEFSLTASSSGSGGSGGGGGGGGLLGSNGNSNNENEKGTTRAGRAQTLIDTITSIIRPDVWTTNGGAASIRFFNGSLIVTAPRSVHEALGGPID